MLYYVALEKYKYLEIVYYQTGFVLVVFTFLIIYCTYSKQRYYPLFFYFYKKWVLFLLFLTHCRQTIYDIGYNWYNHTFWGVLLRHAVKVWRKRIFEFVLWAMPSTYYRLYNLFHFHKMDMLYLFLGQVGFPFFVMHYARFFQYIFNTKMDVHAFILLKLWFAAKTVFWAHCYSVFTPLSLLFPLALSFFFYFFGFLFVLCSFLIFRLWLLCFRVILQLRGFAFAKASLMFIPSSVLFFKHSDACPEKGVFEVGSLDHFRESRKVVSHHRAVLVPWSKTTGRQHALTAVNSWQKLGSSRKKSIPFVFVGSDTSQAVGERCFTRIVWLNDLVVNKELVNRLCYSKILDKNFLITESPVGLNPPLVTPVVYQNLDNVSAVKVKNDFSLSIRKSSTCGWVDLDYNEYVRQLIFNRAFNKLRFDRLSGLGLDNQGFDSGVGVRVAAYKAFVPDLLARRKNSSLNNPFVSSDILRLFRMSSRARKGRPMALGKMTDVVLVLKSLRALYCNHPAFVSSRVPGFESSIPFGFRSWFDRRLLKTNRSLIKSWVTTTYFKAHVVLPFAFLTRTHVHHMQYETRPDRFFILPNSFELILRGFLSKLLLLCSSFISINKVLITQTLTTASLSLDRTLHYIEYVLYRFFGNPAAATVNPKKLKKKFIKNIGSLDFYRWHRLSTTPSDAGIKSRRVKDPLHSFYIGNFALASLGSAVNSTLSLFKVLRSLSVCLDDSGFGLYGRRLGNIVEGSFAISAFACIKNMTPNLLISFVTRGLSILQERFLTSGHQFESVEQKLLLLLVWRAFINAFLEALLFFKPGVFLTYSRLYTVRLRQGITRVGGLFLINRYKFGLGSLNRGGFLFKFTATYNRCLTSFNLADQLVTLDSTDLKLTANRFVVDRKLTRCFWWWLTLGLVPDVLEQRVVERFLCFFDMLGRPFLLKGSCSELVEMFDAVVAPESINFATLAYDPSGSLGASFARAGERFTFSFKTMLFDETVRQVYETIRSSPREVYKFMRGRKPSRVRNYWDTEDAMLAERFGSEFYKNWVRSKLGKTRVRKSSAGLNPLSSLLLLLRRYQRVVLRSKTKRRGALLDKAAEREQHDALEVIYHKCAMVFKVYSLWDKGKFRSALLNDAFGGPETRLRQRVRQVLSWCNTRTVSSFQTSKIFGRPKPRRHRSRGRRRISRSTKLIKTLRNLRTPASFFGSDGRMCVVRPSVYEKACRSRFYGLDWASKSETPLVSKYSGVKRKPALSYSHNARYVNTLFGSSFKTRGRFPLFSYIVGKTQRRTSYLTRVGDRNLFDISLLPVLESLLLLVENELGLLEDEQDPGFLGPLVRLFWLLKNKEGSRRLSAYKDIFGFRSLNLCKRFLHKEYSFEESFFALLGQRVSVVKNPIIGKPLTRHSSFSANVFGWVPKKKKSKKRFAVQKAPEETRLRRFLRYWQIPILSLPRLPSLSRIWKRLPFPVRDLVHYSSWLPTRTVRSLRITRRRWRRKVRNLRSYFAGHKLVRDKRWSSTTNASTAVFNYSWMTRPLMLVPHDYKGSFERSERSRGLAMKLAEDRIAKRGAAELRRWSIRKNRLRWTAEYMMDRWALGKRLRSSRRYTKRDYRHKHRFKVVWSKAILRRVVGSVTRKATPIFTKKRFLGLTKVVFRNNTFAGKFLLSPFSRNSIFDPMVRVIKRITRFKLLKRKAVRRVRRRQVVRAYRMKTRRLLAFYRLTNKFKVVFSMCNMRFLRRENILLLRFLSMRRRVAKLFKQSDANYSGEVFNERVIFTPRAYDLRRRVLVRSRFPERRFFKQATYPFRRGIFAAKRYARFFGKSNIHGSSSASFLSEPTKTTHMMRMLVGKKAMELAFVAELVTRKSVLLRNNVPAWFIRWLRNAGHLLLFRYIAYKRQTSFVVPQFHHAAVPNSSGIFHLIAGFNLGRVKALGKSPEPLRVYHESMDKAGRVAEVWLLPRAARLLFDNSSTRRILQRRPLRVGYRALLLRCRLFSAWAQTVFKFRRYPQLVLPRPRFGHVVSTKGFSFQAKRKTFIDIADSFFYALIKQRRKLRIKGRVRALFKFGRVRGSKFVFRRQGVFFFFKNISLVGNYRRYRFFRRSRRLSRVIEFALFIRRLRTFILRRVLKRLMFNTNPAWVETRPKYARRWSHTFRFAPRESRWPAVLKREVLKQTRLPGKNRRIRTRRVAYRNSRVRRRKLKFMKWRQSVFKRIRGTLYIKAKYSKFTKLKKVPRRYFRRFYRYWLRRRQYRRFPPSRSGARRQKRSFHTVLEHSSLKRLPRWYRKYRRIYRRAVMQTSRRRVVQHFLGSFIVGAPNRFDLFNSKLKNRLRGVRNYLLPFSVRQAKQRWFKFESRVGSLDLKNFLFGLNLNLWAPGTLGMGRNLILDHIRPLRFLDYVGQFYLDKPLYHRSKAVLPSLFSDVHYNVPWSPLVNGRSIYELNKLEFACDYLWDQRSRRPRADETEFRYLESETPSRDLNSYIDNAFSYTLTGLYGIHCPTFTSAAVSDLLGPTPFDTLYSTSLTPWWVNRFMFRHQNMNYVAIDNFWFYKTRSRALLLNQVKTKSYLRNPSVKTVYEKARYTTYLAEVEERVQNRKRPGSREPNTVNAGVTRYRFFFRHYHQHSFNPGRYLPITISRRVTLPFSFSYNPSADSLDGKLSPCSQLFIDNNDDPFAAFHNFIHDEQGVAVEQGEHVDERNRVLEDSALLDTFFTDNQVRYYNTWLYTTQRLDKMSSRSNNIKTLYLDEEGIATKDQALFDAFKGVRVKRTIWYLLDHVFPYYGQEPGFTLSDSYWDEEWPRLSRSLRSYRSLRATSYASVYSYRSKRKGFSFFFSIDESRSNNYTITRCSTSYRSGVVSTLLGYGQNVHVPAKGAGVSPSRESSKRASIKYANEFNATHGNLSKPTSRGLVHKYQTIFLWYLLSRSWSTIRLHGFGGFVDYSSHCLLPNVRVLQNFRSLRNFVMSQNMVINRAFVDWFSRYLSHLLLVFILVSQFLSFVFVFGFCCL